VFALASALSAIYLVEERALKKKKFGAIGFTGIGHDSGMHRFNAALLVIGVFTGSMLWWLVVTALAGRLRGRIADRHLALLNHVTAAVLAVFGAGAVLAGVTAS